ncbi:MAG: PfkB family carbohydrate kinase, partial [Paracoccaceae bacterium]|nr:PfkB family carbohydrate kinase [Paracoccaceae bacterium]
KAEARDGRVIRRAAVPVGTVRDTTGAGDVYAAGIVHGMTAGWALSRSMDFAAALAAEQVTVEGPTPPTTLARIFHNWSQSYAPDPRPNRSVSA